MRTSGRTANWYRYAAAPSTAMTAKTGWPMRLVRRRTTATATATSAIHNSVPERLSQAARGRQPADVRARPTDPATRW